MAIEFFSSIDLNQNQIIRPVIHNSSEITSGGVLGQIYVDTDNQNKLKYHNGSGFIDLTQQGDITSVTLTGGTGITATNTNSSSGDYSSTIALDLSELTDMTQAITASEDELILLDNGADRRKLISEIPLSAFNNDSGFTSNDGDITAVVAGAGLTDGGSTGSVTVNVGQGTGITVNADDVAVTAAQTGITSVLNTSLVIGRDADNQIKFGTDNDIIFRVDGASQLSFVNGAIKPTTDNDIDLGTSSRQFKDGFFHGTLEADALTINGTTLSDTVESLISGMTAGSATAVTVTDSTANTPFPVVFNNESGGLLDDTGTFIYNPSTGTLSVTNIIVSGDTTTANETVKIVENNTLEFEGAAGTDAAHELKLTTAQLSGDQTITLPDSTGTVALTSQITGTNSGTNTGDVTLGGSLDYITISNQVITRNAIDLTTDVTGTLPTANTAAKVTSIVAGDGIDVSGATGDVTVTAETASATNPGIVELAADSEVKAGSGSGKVVDATQMAAQRIIRSTISASSVNAATNKRAIINHALDTNDIVIELYLNTDATFRSTVHAEVTRTSDGSTASTNHITVDFGTDIPADVNVVIISGKGGTSKSPSYA